MMEICHLYESSTLDLARVSITLIIIIFISQPKRFQSRANHYSHSDDAFNSVNNACHAVIFFIKLFAQLKLKVRFVKKEAKKKDIYKIYLQNKYAIYFHSARKREERFQIQYIIFHLNFNHV